MLLSARLAASSSVVMAQYLRFERSVEVQALDSAQDASAEPGWMRSLAAEGCAQGVPRDRVEASWNPLPWSVLSLRPLALETLQTAFLFGEKSIRDANCILAKSEKNT